VMLAARVEAWAQEYEQRGMQKGMQQGMQQGIQQGIQQGMQQGKAEILLRLLERRFGQVPPHIEALLAQADIPLIEAWTDRLLDARTLEDIFTH
uniref:DUF4351 domain-containing protein n=1 Tax=Candidatus Magnetaquicoccus inordinatus TaxID=2496818 RepID=UPI00102B1FC5